MLLFFFLLRFCSDTILSCFFLHCITRQLRRHTAIHKYSLQFSICSRSTCVRWERRPEGLSVALPICLYLLLKCYFAHSNVIHAIWVSCTSQVDDLKAAFGRGIITPLSSSKWVNWWDYEWLLVILAMSLWCNYVRVWPMQRWPNKVFRCAIPNRLTAFLVFRLEACVANNLNV